MRQGTRRLGLPRTEIVFEAVFDNASLRDVTVKIEGLKIQLREMAEQVRFFRDSNEFGLIEESLGQISRTRAFVSRHSTISARSFDVTGKMRVAGVRVWRTTPAQRNWRAIISGVRSGPLPYSTRLLPNSGVRDRVQNVSEEIHGNVGEPDREDAALDEVIIAVGDCLNGETADSRPGKDGFSHDRTG